MALLFVIVTMVLALWWMVSVSMLLFQVLHKKATIKHRYQKQKELIEIIIAMLDVLLVSIMSTHCPCAIKMMVYSCLVCSCVLEMVL